MTRTRGFRFVTNIHIHYTNEDQLPGSLIFDIFIELPITINKS